MHICDSRFEAHNCQRVAISSVTGTYLSMAHCRFTIYILRFRVLPPRTLARPPPGGGLLNFEFGHGSGRFMPLTGTTHAPAQRLLMVRLYL